MSYPFKGFKSSGPIWGRRDVVLGCGYYDASYPSAWECGEVPRFLCTWRVGQLVLVQLPHMEL
jgi:hypothetical protein